MQGLLPRRPPPDTERLWFRELCAADLDFVAAMLADAEVMRFYPKRHTREESAQWIERQRRRYETDGHGLWLVGCRRTREPVGQIGLSLQLVEGREELEVGYLLHRPHWKRGFATEAARACRDFAFAQPGIREVVSLIRPVNLPSQAVARRIGMLPGRRVQFGGFEHIVFAVGA